MDAFKLIFMNHSIFSKLYLGTTAPLTGWLVSLSTHNEELQCISLLIGITIGLFHGIDWILKKLFKDG